MPTRQGLYHWKQELGENRALAQFLKLGFTYVFLLAVVIYPTEIFKVYQISTHPEVLSI